MKTRRNLALRLSLLLVTLAALVQVGCQGPEVANDSARPWNGPKSWETGGLPSTINEGR